MYAKFETDNRFLSFNLAIQAYDGHMNLILSDVEETIMIVDQPDGAPEGQNTVNVGTSSCRRRAILVTSTFIGSETEDGHVVCARRWCHLGTPPGV